MTVLTGKAFSVVDAHVTKVNPPGTQGGPATDGLDVKVSVVPAEAQKEGVALPDHFQVVAHVPKGDPTSPAWERVPLQDQGAHAAGWRGSVLVHEFIAQKIPVSVGALSAGIWFSIEAPPKVTVTAGQSSLTIDSSPGATLAYGQGYGDNTKPRT